MITLACLRFLLCIVAAIATYIVARAEMTVEAQYQNNTVLTLCIVATICGALSKWGAILEIVAVVKPQR